MQANMLANMTDPLNYQLFMLLNKEMWRILHILNTWNTCKNNCNKSSWKKKKRDSESWSFFVGAFHFINDYVFFYVCVTAPTPPSDSTRRSKSMGLVLSDLVSYPQIRWVYDRVITGLTDRAVTCRRGGRLWPSGWRGTDSTNSTTATIWIDHTHVF